jgi:hypothetical protein
MKSPSFRLAFLIPWLALASSTLADEVTYWRDVRPVLRKNCTVCHNPRQVKETEISGGLTLDTYEAVLKRKDTRKLLIKSGRSGESLLYQLVTTDTEKRMPLGAKPLPPEAIAILRRWIDGGAKEGTRPDVSPVKPPVKVIRRRQLDVILTAGEGPGKPLALALKVGPLSPVVAVAFHPEGKLLATGSYGRVTVWDLGTGKPVKVLTSVLGAVNDLRFSPDGKLLAVAGGQPSAKGDLRLFTVGDWKLQAVLAGHEDVVASVSFRPDGKALASASYDRTVRTWNVTTGKVERVLTMHSDFVHAVVWSPDGKYLLSGSKDRSVRMVEAGTGRSRFTFSDREQDVLAVAVSRDGKAVVASGLEPGLSWWNTMTGAKIRSVGGHRGAVQELAFSGDGSLLVSAGSDGTLRLWKGSDGTFVRAISVGSLVYATALDHKGQLAAAGSFDGLVRLYETATGRLLATLLSTQVGEGQEWLAITPAGYTAGSTELLAMGRWSQAGKALPAAETWKVLRRPDLVARGVRGEELPAPVWGK